jgi:hypothetical protein
MSLYETEFWNPATILSAIFCERLASDSHWDQASGFHVSGYCCGLPHCLIRFFGMDWRTSWAVTIRLLSRRHGDWNVPQNMQMIYHSLISYTAYPVFHSFPFSSLTIFRSSSCSHLLFSTASLSFAITSLGSLAPKTALPATMTFAPASAAVSIVF